MAFNGGYRWGPSQSLAVASGAAGSSAVFGSQTRLVRLMSTLPCTVLISETPSVSSTVVNNTGVPLAANVPEIVRVTPGQRLSATQGTASATTLTITEMG